MFNFKNTNQPSILIKTVYFIIAAAMGRFFRLYATSHPNIYSMLNTEVETGSQMSLRPPSGRLQYSVSCETMGQSEGELPF